jgi:nucleotide-binding universal stress UspA family protein
MSNAPILVGVDGSPESKTALAWAVDLARDLGAAVIVVHATEIELSTALGPEGSSDPQELRRDLERVVREEWCSALTAGDVPHEVVVQDGGPALVLLAVAERARARTIVVGPRGAGGTPSLPLGSVGLHLAQYADRPVTIVRDVASPQSLER